MSKNKTPIPHLSSDSDLAHYLLKNVGDNLKEAIKATVSVIVRTEMENIRTKENDNNLVFNGTYGRNLSSPVGKVESIPIPRFRTGNSEHAIKSLEIFNTEQQRFFDLIGEMHLAGISQRKIDKLCRNVLGSKVSPRKTKHIFEESMQKECFKINSQSLMDAPCDFLFLDGIWSSVKLKNTGETRKQACLVALGMSFDGSKKHILGMQLVFEEDEKSWKKLIEELEARGLNFSKVKLAICDSASGLLTSLERCYPNLKIQICLSHRYRNVLKHTPYKLKKEMGIDLQSLTKSRSKDEFLTKVKQMTLRWKTIAPRALTSLNHKLEYSLSYFQFDESIWSTIRTTNPLDRTFREVRRRTSIHNNHYESPYSMDKYHNAILGNLNRNYFNNPI